MAVTRWRPGVDVGASSKVHDPLQILGERLASATSLPSHENWTCVYSQPSPTCQYDAVNLSVAGPFDGATSSQGPIHVGSGSALATGETAVARTNAATTASADAPSRLAVADPTFPDDSRSPPIGCAAPSLNPFARQAVFAGVSWAVKTSVRDAARAIDVRWRRVRLGMWVSTTTTRAVAIDR